MRRPFFLLLSLIALAAVACLASSGCAPKADEDASPSPAAAADGTAPAPKAQGDVALPAADKPE